MKETVLPTASPEVVVVPTDAEPATVGVNVFDWNFLPFFEVKVTVTV